MKGYADNTNSLIVTLKTHKNPKPVPTSGKPGLFEHFPTSAARIHSSGLNFKDLFTQTRCASIVINNQNKPHFKKNNY
jgi:hypothetical protein